MFLGDRSGQVFPPKEPVGLKLELSSEGRYALRALVYLARVGERVTADRISTEAHIPRRLLARILAKLSHASLVETEQGRGGGSRLARPANKITLREAVETVEGPFGVARCIMEDRACGEGAPCALHEAWVEGQQVILEYLGTQTIEVFISRTASDKLPRA
jgi:Rrf2 family protein